MSSHEMTRIITYNSLIKTDLDFITISMEYLPGIELAYRSKVKYYKVDRGEALS